MKRRWLTVILIVVCFIALPGSVQAWSSELDGRPHQFLAGGGKTGYYVWQDEYGFHLWATAGGNHSFAGTIRTDGRIYDVKGHHLDGGGSFGAYPEIQNRFWFEAINAYEPARFVFTGLEVEYEPHKIQFTLKTSDSANGLHFRISGGSYIAFDLQMDGRGIGRRQIWVGENGWHPDTHVFRYRQ